jgi:glycogen debranching enzyme
VTGQFQYAREHILAFATTLKHGLIPNLIDSIKTPRYNSRDSPFWYLQNVQDYIELAPEGEKFLKQKVKRRFPADDKWVPHDSPEAYAYSSTIAEVVQEILQRHASGIHFREYNAGPNLDSQMSDEGFNIDIEVDWSTGLIKGGNERNCGTWMDKMGESERAGTKGLPGTPRDGAPVEITGLLASALRWLDGLSKRNAFPFKGVEIRGASFGTTGPYSDLLPSQKTARPKRSPMHNGMSCLSETSKSSTTCHWVCQSLLLACSAHPQTDFKQDKSYAIDSSLVARRGIYKDVVGSAPSHAYADYQLRCNFPIAMSVAPELFDPLHARDALQVFQNTLWGPLGVATLDPEDQQYRPYYDNANDSDDPAVAKGRKYVFPPRLLRMLTLCRPATTRVPSGGTLGATSCVRCCTLKARLARMSTSPCTRSTRCWLAGASTFERTYGPDCLSSYVNSVDWAVCSQLADKQKWGILSRFGEPSGRVWQLR